MKLKTAQFNFSKKSSTSKIITKTEITLDTHMMSTKSATNVNFKVMHLLFSV